MRYTVHPFSSGLLDGRTLLTGLALLAVLGLGITTYFVVERGWMAAAFAVAGASLLFLYDAAPIPLKSIGLGEFAVLLVWTPLMVGGGFAMITGQLSANAMLASLPYGLGVMTILNGKHIDQMSFDSQRDPHPPRVDRGICRARAEHCCNRRDLRHHRHPDRSRTAHAVCGGERHRAPARCPRHKHHEPTASPGAARRVRRLAALVSPRLASTQPRVRLGVYRRISRWRNLARRCVTPPELIAPFGDDGEAAQVKRLTDVRTT